LRSPQASATQKQRPPIALSARRTFEPHNSYLQ